MFNWKAVSIVHTSFSPAQVRKKYLKLFQICDIIIIDFR